MKFYIKGFQCNYWAKEIEIDETLNFLLCLWLKLMTYDNCSLIKHLNRNWNNLVDTKIHLYVFIRFTYRVNLW